MAKLHAAARNALPSKDFALPGERKYPIEDRSHAANAKARASGKPEQGRVDAAVARKYPNMGKGGDPPAKPGAGSKVKAGPEHAKKLAIVLMAPRPGAPGARPPMGPRR
jgi:hypothetical protein